MARGWESKQVEEQQSIEKAQPSEIKTSRLADQERQRRVQGLSMQRERILSERTASPHRRSALENALADVERELEQLGWTIHI